MRRYEFSESTSEDIKRHSRESICLRDCSSERFANSEILMIFFIEDDILIVEIGTDFSSFRSDDNSPLSSCPREDKRE